MIERIGRLNLEENEAAPAEQLGPSQQIPKWVMKTLESVHFDEVRNIGANSSITQEDGGDAYYLNSSYVYYMDVSYDFD